MPDSREKPQWVEEENYFFALSRYGKKLADYLKKCPEFIRPLSRLNEIRNVIEAGLEDISITRSSICWGIPVPFDPAQVVYVWFDALINYLSGLGYPAQESKVARYWPCNLHVIGKDITRFHCIIWPAMLMSAGLELPKTVWGHGFVFLGGAKMSKTTGTVIDPLEMARKYGADPLRYFLMREVPFDKDGEFTIDKFLSRYQSDLANDLGNLVHRVLSMVHRYNKGRLIKNGDVGGEKDDDLISTVLDAGRQYEKYMDSYQLSQALMCVWNMVTRANRYVEESKPWVLKKEGKREQLNKVLYNLVETTRIIAVVLEPFMPRTAETMRKQIGIPDQAGEQQLGKSREWGQLVDGFQVGEPQPLFPRLE